jgi:hypothetical protein
LCRCIHRARSSDGLCGIYPGDNFVFQVSGVHCARSSEVRDDGRQGLSAPIYITSREALSLNLSHMSSHHMRQWKLVQTDRKSSTERDTLGSRADTSVRQLYVVIGCIKSSLFPLIVVFLLSRFNLAIDHASTWQ